MELRTGIHLSADVLQAFSLGKLDDTTAEVVVNHLETCSACHQKAAAMSSDDFLNRLRDAHSRSGTPAPAKPLSGVPQSAPPSPSPSSTKLPLMSLPPELAGHPQYEIVRELGRGGMGVVYLAKNRLLGRQEVLKVVNKALLERPGVAERFLREIRSAALLNHPNVVTAYNALEMGGSLAFAMEYVEGQDLAKVVKERGPLPVAYACHYVREASLGLQHAFEKHMVHRDIKPQNLILAREGHKHIVKVLDFGLAKVLREKKQEHELTGSGAMLGTPDYIAPEQTLDAASADIRADIYSLGCTLYFLLTGHPPFTGRSLFEILQAHHSMEAKALNLLRSEVSPELDAVVRKMMAKEPAQRYQTPIEVAQALMPFIKQTTKGVPGGASLFQQSTVIRKEGPKSMSRAAELAAKRETEGGFGSTSAEVRRARNAQRVQALTAKPAGKKKLLLGAAAAGVALLTFLVLLGLVGLWAGGVFKVKTKDGTIVLENLPPDAEVTVDGGKVSVMPADGQPFEIRVAASGKHRLEVKKGGFKTFGEDVEIDAGGRKAILVHLESENLSRLPPKPVENIPAPVFDRKQATILRGQWKVEANQLVQTDAVTDNCCILFGDPQWKNYDYSFDAVKTNGAFGISALFRRKDAKNYMVFDIAGWQNRKYTVECFVQGQHNWVAADRPGSMKKDEKNHVLVKVRDDHFQCYLNNALIYEFDDRRHANGAVGFRCWGAAVRVSSIKVESPDGKSLWEGPPEIEARKAPDKSNEGFVPLFNGKDLTGWKTHPQDKASWEVKDGILVGSGPLGHLFSEKDNYTNFHFRVEAMINDGGNSGQMFRTVFGPGFPKGYEAQIDSTHRDPIRTGSLYPSFPLAPGGREKIVITEQLHKPNEWFIQEVIADGNHIIIKVNGKTTVDFVDPNNTYTKGHLALQQHDQGTIVKFRKIEIKELPPEKTTGAKSAIDPLSVGSIWKGTRSYRKGAWANVTVHYEIHVLERDGNKFKGLRFDNGSGRNRGNIEGEIDGETITWRELFPDGSKGSVSGKLNDNTIRLTFHVDFKTGQRMTEGDGELKRELPAPKK